MADDSRVSLRTTNSANSANAAEPLYQVKLLAALRSGDPAAIQPFLAEIARDKRSSTSTGLLQGAQVGDSVAGASALHLAIRCASTDTVGLLLAHRAISPNAVSPPGSGTTALHLAASLGRADAVKLLLEQPEVDDTLKDSQGRTCLDVAKGRAVVRAIQDSRAFLDASYRSLLRSYILSPPTASPPPTLLALLSAPRVRLVDLGYVDDSSGTTLLHEAARRKDLRAVELAIRAGADVFVRDRRGKTVGDAAGKDDRVKAFLRQFTNQDTTLLEGPGGSPGEVEPAVLKGYLNKYTNVAKGWGTRWVVLKDGVLSYYRHQDDETVASRGSIAMKTAVLKASTNGEKDRVRFEVHSAPSRGNNSMQKWYMKANHPVEATRWTQAISRSIAFEKAHARAPGADAPRRPSLDSQDSSLGLDAGAGTLSIARDRTSLSGTFARRRMESARGSSLYVAANSGTGTATDEDDADADHAPPPGPSTFIAADDAVEDESDPDAQAPGIEVPPHEAEFAQQGPAAETQLALLGQLLGALAPAPGAPVQAADVHRTAAEALAGAARTVAELADMARERDNWWRARLRAERARQDIWERSLAAVVAESEGLESELRTRSRRRTSRIIEGAASPDGGNTLRAKGTLRFSGANVPEAAEQEESAIEGLPTSVSTAPAGAAPSTLPASAPSIRAPAPGELPMPAPLSPTSRAMSPGTPTPTASRRFRMTGPNSPGMEDGDGDTDDEDEFFDAIEANALPNLVVSAPLAAGGVHAERTLGLADARAEYAAYARLRERLSITSDDRPPMSLWAVLKGSIGKDLTKISFPVFFNEPTSMLQRMAEDMEFSECLDAAAAEANPLRRIAFVAAFAMSNYSSTIGRIAKPFNPMLSETFEYVRLDKEYRYVSEQVSHHPPISACWADSPSWNYYGEVDAQNKFMGKSFEIRPTGIAHADLLLPEEWGPKYPKAQGRIGQDKVVEHYSWKKVTTNVSGFILGQPTIDHYGDMMVTNHRTGDRCTLTFKPRGWRGKDAFEISGEVVDARGNVRYEIAGRWNSQLVARAVGAGKGALNPDVSVSGPTSPSSLQEFFLLWRNTVKPSAPFNLTPFALTLNDCPPALRPLLAPTDCRLRPDQRAFELGRYERANDLKIRQEERQRATRRAREEGAEPPHRPRWFAPETEADTGERVWAPARTDNHEVAYWAERRRVWNSEGSERWKDVTPIFIEDEP